MDNKKIIYKVMYYDFCRTEIKGKTVMKEKTISASNIPECLKICSDLKIRNIKYIETPTTMVCF